MKESTQREKAHLFCAYLAKLGNITEAAIRAGFPQAQAYQEGVAILRHSKWKRLVGTLAKETTISAHALVRAGLERLAFGSGNDAAVLVFSEEIPTPAQLAQLDLFNVSELKRIKGGGVEIKLFDRQKALEKLFEYANTTNSEQTARSLLAALSGQSESEDAENAV